MVGYVKLCVATLKKMTWAFRWNFTKCCWYLRDICKKLKDKNKMVKLAWWTSLVPNMNNIMKLEYVNENLDSCWQILLVVECVVFWLKKI